MTRQGRSAAALLVVALVVVLGLCGCVPASPDTDTYQDAAAQALETAASEVATVAELLRLLDEEKLPRAAAVAQLRYSEQGLEKSSTWFTGLTAPTGSDRLGDRVGGLLDDAAELLERARTTVHRNGRANYPRLVDALGGLGSKLERLEGRLA